jgi:hypothetical protein
MKLIRSIPALGAIPELQVFYCRECDTVEGVDRGRLSTGIE